MGRKELAVMIAAVSVTAAVCLNLPSRGDTPTVKASNEVGRYQLCAGAYEATTVTDGKQNTSQVPGLFRIDTVTGDVSRYSHEAGRVGKTGFMVAKWSPLIETDEKVDLSQN